MEVLEEINGKMYDTKQSSLPWADSIIGKVSGLLYSENTETPEMQRTFSFLWYLNVFMFSHITNNCEQSKASAVVACQAQIHLHSFHVFHWEILPFTK